jgi:hypothetical protein
LIYAWLALFIAAWILGYYEYWYPAFVIVIALAGTAIIAWALICCTDCLKAIKDWVRGGHPEFGHKCCVFLQWTWLGHAILSGIVFPALAVGAASGATGALAAGILALVCDFLPAGICNALQSVLSSGESSDGTLAVALVGGFAIAWGLILDRAGCSFPNPFKPKSWPKCSCSK